MASLTHKVQNALDEARMLVLGSQVLLGFQFRGVIETGFDRLPRHAQFLNIFGLGLMVVALGLLLWPGSFHQIVEQGEDTRRVHRFTTQVMLGALLPFALGLGINVFLASETIFGSPAAAVFGSGTLSVALFFWYGIETIHRGRKASRFKEGQEMRHTDHGSTPLDDKIRQVLTEARVVLPGAQALLGFQFATFLMEGFDKLPNSSRYLHSLSLGLIALSIVFLMTPAAYHRIVEDGESTARFHQFAGRMLIAAMVPLALGITGDVFVTVRKVTMSASWALLAALMSASMFFGMWFGYTAYRRANRAEAAQSNSKSGKPPDRSHVSREQKTV